MRRDVSRAEAVKMAVGGYIPRDTPLLPLSDCAYRLTPGEVVLPSSTVQALGQALLDDGYIVHAAEDLLEDDE